jgi:hypothetical protein
MQTGGARSKFGVSVSQLHAILPTINALGIKVIGLHVHKGSGIHDASVWARTATFLASLASHFPDLRILDLGGGLGVSYRDTDPLLDLTKLDAELVGYAAGELRMRASGEHHQPLLRAALDPVADLRVGHRLGTLETGQDELSRRAGGLHTPPCSPGAPARPRAHPAEHLS